LLSTGAYSWSGNALPLPKVQINTLGYVEVPFTQKLLAFKGSFSHGWFGDLLISYETRLNITYLHQKDFFLRMGKPVWKFRLYGGFVHNVMWGNEANFSNFNLPLSQAYLGVISGDSWASSRIGNHLGSIDLGFDIHGENWNYIFSRQTFYEAGALYWLRAIPDGLNSFSMSKRSVIHSSKFEINKILVEFFHSVNQGGDVSSALLGVYGRESYFNHYIYTNGWTNQGRIMGTPFIQLNNSRVYVYHVGIAGTYKNWNWRTKWSLSQNYGNYDALLADSPPTQLSTIIEASKPIKILNGAELRTALSFDIGKLYPNAVGLYVGVRKNGFLSGSK
jgi:Capsule assembly protein Wzi